MDKATKLARVKLIRDNALQILKGRGEWQPVSNMKFLGASVGECEISYRTPFQHIPETPEAMRYLAAQLGKKLHYRYGLDIWFRRKKVLNSKRPSGAVYPAGLKFQGISASMSLLGQRLAMRSRVSLAQA